MFCSTACTQSASKNILGQGKAPTPANASRAAKNFAARSPFLNSSNAKSWGPAGLPVGSDLVIDDCTHGILAGGGCDHVVSAAT